MIKSIVFDLGGVLYTYDHNKLMGEVSHELQIAKETVINAWKKGIVAFETGKISEQYFWKIFLNELKVTYDLKILHKVVINHFKPILKTLAIVHKLKDKFILGLISNQTSWIDELDKKYHFRELFNISLISKEVSLRKPQKEIFHLFIKKSNLKPNEIIFIDDSLDYKKEIEKIGIEFIHYKDSKQLAEKLIKRGLF